MSQIFEDEDEDIDILHLGSRFMYHEAVGENSEKDDYFTEKIKQLSKRPSYFWSNRIVANSSFEPPFFKLEVWRAPFYITCSVPHSGKEETKDAVDEEGVAKHLLYSEMDKTRRSFCERHKSQYTSDALLSTAELQPVRQDCILIYLDWGSGCDVSQILS